MTVMCQDALKRRISPTYVLEQDPKNKNYTLKIYVLEKGDSMSSFCCSPRYYEGNWKQISNALAREVLGRFDQQYGEIFSPVNDSTFGEIGYGYHFDLKPPDRLPRCEAHAIAEPLKVRMITKNEPETWVLKPVQMAMWSALKKFKVFDLTHGPEIDISRLHYGGQWLCSGDYKSATDKLNSDIMETAIDVLKDYIPEEFRDWFIWEGGKHQIDYPKSTLLESCIQTRGQLMGSLLSFPILCLANFTTYAYAKMKSMGDKIFFEKIENILRDPRLSCFINGDDILFTCDGPRSRLYREWKTTAHSIGLELSVGKTYLSKYFGLINSQMILSYSKVSHRAWTQLKYMERFSKEARSVKVTIPCLVQLAQGKCKTYKKLQVSGQLDFSKALEILPTELIVDLNRKILKSTPESIDLPKELGGIGKLKAGYKPSLKDKEVYAFKVLRHRPRIIQKIDDDLLITRVPELAENFIYATSSQIPYCKRYAGYVNEEEEDDLPLIFPWKEFKDFKRFYKKKEMHTLRLNIFNMDLLEEKGLDQFKSNLRIVDRKFFKRLDHLLRNFFNWKNLGSDEDW
jgi:hypothetical protein